VYQSKTISSCRQTDRQTDLHYGYPAGMTEVGCISAGNWMGISGVFIRWCVFVGGGIWDRGPSVKEERGNLRHRAICEGGEGGI
jgi:hypothetical protein